MNYDAAGNLTNDGGLTYTYDATGQQATASYTGYVLQQYYDGNGLRAKKSETGAVTYYLRSSVLGGQVVAEISSSGTMQRGYVYLGGQLLAVQQSNAVSWIHQDPIAKSKRVTNGSGTVVSTIELDPWGGNTNRNNNAGFQPRAFTTYERDGDASDEAMFRRYNRWWSRFDQPDPYDGSYDLANPQSFNRYTYVQNDPPNRVDPMGLEDCGREDVCTILIPKDPPGGVRGFFGGGAGDGGITTVDPPIGEGQGAVPTGDLERIRADIEKAIAAKVCADFLKALLDETAMVTGEPYRDIMVTFDNIKFTYGNVGPYGGRTQGSFEQGTASAIINPFESNFISADRSAFIRTQTAQNFLGETLHHVGTRSSYRDGAYANALNRILVRQNKDSPKTFSDKTEAEGTNASLYWHPIAFARCQMRYR